MAFCDSCGSELFENAVFCGKCGARVVAPKPTCKKCGNELSENAVFCGKCGERVAAPKPICKKCGNELIEDAVFCGKCGESVIPKIPVCEKCGAVLVDEASFCGSCGARVTVQSITENPGVPVIRESNNASVDSGTQTSITASASQPKPQAPSETVVRNDTNVLSGIQRAPIPIPTSIPQPVSSKPSESVLKTGDDTTSAKQSAPVFSPPSQAPAAPVFTPPARTFTPPRRTHNGPVCYYHDDEPVVAKCAKCGKFLCQDCFDSYGVSGGEYAGKALCYGCTRDLVAENVQILKKNKTSIIVTFVMTLVGMVICAFIGGSLTAQSEYMWVGILVGAMIGGCFWTFIKGWFRRIINATIAGDGIVGFLVGLFFGFIIEAAISIYRTIRKIIECLVYLKRTSSFIQSDSESLQQMADYMEYTKIRNENRGVDIETLLSQNSQLANNSVAQMARTQSEEQIEASMRHCVASINENGEIIRSFSA